MIEMIAVIENGHWRPGIGDPTVLGWATTVAYFIATGLCLVYVLRAGRMSPAGEVNWHRAFWWGLTVFILLMAINKQLDLQIPFLQFIRQMAWEQGWFAERHVVEKWIVLGFGFIGLILLAWLGWTFRRVSGWRNQSSFGAGGGRQHVLALFGIALLAFFVLIRASGNSVVIFGYKLGRFPMYRVLEVGGIVCIGVSALMGLRRLRQKTEDGNRKKDLNPPASDL